MESRSIFGRMREFLANQHALWGAVALLSVISYGCLCMSRVFPLGQRAYALYGLYVLLSPMLFGMLKMALNAWRQEEVRLGQLLDYYRRSLLTSLVYGAILTALYFLCYKMMVFLFGVVFVFSQMGLLELPYFMADYYSVIAKAFIVLATVLIALGYVLFWLKIIPGVLTYLDNVELSLWRVWRTGAKITKGQFKNLYAIGWGILWRSTALSSLPLLLFLYFGERNILGFTMLHIGRLIVLVYMAASVCGVWQQLLTAREQKMEWQVQKHIWVAPINQPTLLKIEDVEAKSLSYYDATMPGGEQEMFQAAVLTERGVLLITRETVAGISKKCGKINRISLVNQLGMQNRLAEIKNACLEAVYAGTINQRYYFCASGTSGDEGQEAILCADSEMALQWVYYLPQNIHRVSKLVFSKTHDILFWAQASSWQNENKTLTSSVFSLDEDGELLWRKDYTETESLCYAIYPKDDGIDICYANVIEQLSFDGETLKRQEFPWHFKQILSYRKENQMTAVVVCDSQIQSKTLSQQILEEVVAEKRMVAQPKEKIVQIQLTRQSPAKIYDVKDVASDFKGYVINDQYYWYESKTTENYQQEFWLMVGDEIDSPQIAINLGLAEPELMQFLPEPVVDTVGNILLVWHKKENNPRGQSHGLQQLLLSAQGIPLKTQQQMSEAKANSGLILNDGQTLWTIGNVYHHQGSEQEQVGLQIGTFTLTKDIL